VRDDGRSTFIPQPSAAYTKGETYGRLRRPKGQRDVTVTTDLDFDAGTDDAGAVAAINNIE